MIKIKTITGLLIIMASVIVAVAQNDHTNATRLLVIEEVHFNDALHDSRIEVFIPPTDLTNSVRVRFTSTNGAAFLEFIDLFVSGTNIWFRSCEFGRNPPPKGTGSPLYMIISGSILFRGTGFYVDGGPEYYHLVVGDNNGIKKWDKHFTEADGTDIETRFVLKAERE